MFTMVALLTLLPFAVPTSAVIPNEQPKQGFSVDVYISYYGTVTGDPEESAKIQRFGETYTFTDDINARIYVQRSGVTIDGNGYTLDGWVYNTWEYRWMDLPCGFTLRFVNGVTIKNVQIVNFDLGFRLVESNSITIKENVVSTGYGVELHGSTYANIYENIFSTLVGIRSFNSDYNTYTLNSITPFGGIQPIGMMFNNSNYNIIRQNHIRHFIGVWFIDYCNNNKLYQNVFNDCYYAALLIGGSSHNNRIYLNDFKNNNYDCLIEYAMWNYWDKNYWDTYNGTDSDGDLIGDTPYVISGDYTNVDYHPLMLPARDYLNYPRKTGGWERHLMK